MSDIYDEIEMGQLATIRGHRAVYLHYASYGGGSGPLWAIEGRPAEFTTSFLGPYQKGVCRRVHSDRVEMELSDGSIVEIPLGDFGRYDQFHLPPDSRFDFHEEDIVLVSTREISG